MPFLFLILLTTFSLESQVDNPPERHLMEGYWSGELTHPGGYRDTYTFILQLKKEGEGFTGWSAIASKDVYGEMLVRGTVFKSSLLILEDVELIEDEINPGMEWCVKRYQLILIKEGNQLRLEGDWQGETSFGTCDPGKVILTKQKPRA